VFQSRLAAPLQLRGAPSATDALKANPAPSAIDRRALRVK
jgi:hypothetical protein